MESSESKRVKRLIHPEKGEEYDDDDYGEEEDQQLIKKQDEEIFEGSSDSVKDSVKVIGNRETGLSLEINTVQDPEL